MNKLLAVLIASSFVLGSASGFAADAVNKKEELTAEQKSEIRDRAARLKSERANTEQAKTTPNAPAKKAEPKHTSKAKALNGKPASKVTGTTLKKTPAKV